MKREIPMRYRVIPNNEGIHALVDHCKRYATAIGFDIETTGLNWWGEDKIVGIGISLLFKGHIDTHYIPLGHTKDPNLDFNVALKALKPLLEDPTIMKVGANIKFDAHFMARYNINVSPLHDVQVMARLIRSDYMKVGLDILIQKEFNAVHQQYLDLKKYCKQVLGWTEKDHLGQTYADVPIRILGPYCGADVYWTLRLGLLYVGMLKKDSRILGLYKTLEQPLIQAVVDMEKAGIRVNIVYLEEIKEGLASKVSSLEAQIYELAGRVFNIDSPKQMQEILPKFGIEPELRRRKKADGETTETLSMDKRVLEKYSKKVPLIARIQEFKLASRLLNTYVNNMLEKANSGQSIVHTQLKQDAARTGRFSCADPNLQNLPREDEEEFLIKMFSIRKAIIPFLPKSLLISIDYSQIEYRILAHFSEDPALLKVFRDGEDFHAYVGGQLYEVAIDKLTKEQRAIGKKFNFAQVYGAGEKALSEQCEILMDRVTHMIGIYNKRFPGIARFKQQVFNFCRSHGYIRNPFGRRQIIHPKLAYRAVNALIQGTAADILKVAILRVSRLLNGKRSKLLFPVHDELVFHYDPRDGNMIPEIVQVMTRFRRNKQDMFLVPLEVEVSLCRDNWSKKEEFGILDNLELSLSKKMEKPDVSMPGNTACIGGGTVGTVPVRKTGSAPKRATTGWD